MRWVMTGLLVGLVGGCGAADSDDPVWAAIGKGETAGADSVVQYALGEVRNPGQPSYYPYVVLDASQTMFAITVSAELYEQREGKLTQVGHTAVGETYSYVPSSSITEHLIGMNGPFDLVYFALGIPLQSAPALAQ